MVNVHHNISSLQPYVPFGFNTKSQVWQNLESVTHCWFCVFLFIYLCFPVLSLLCYLNVVACVVFGP